MNSNVIQLIVLTWYKDVTMKGIVKTDQMNYSVVSILLQIKIIKGI